MSIFATILATIFFLLGAGQAITGILGWTGKLPGNPYVGIRVPEVRKSEELWITAHKIAGPFWTLSGLTLMAAGALSLNAHGVGSWLLVVGAVIATLVFVGMGAGIAAHTVAMIDARAQAEGGCDSGSCGCGSGGCGSAEDASAESSATGAATGATTDAAQGSDSCCSSDSAHSHDDPSKDCGVTGGCGSCALNGMCEGGNERFQAPEVDLEAVRTAAKAAK